jgi:hypothetical protein
MTVPACQELPGVVAQFESSPLRHPEPRRSSAAGGISRGTILGEIHHSALAFSSMKPGSAWDDATLENSNCTTTRNGETRHTRELPVTPASCRET